VLLELLEQVAEPARDHTAGGGAAKQAAEAALQEIAETAAGQACVDRVGGGHRGGGWSRVQTG